MYLITQWFWMKVKPPGITDPKDLDIKMESFAGLGKVKYSGHDCLARRFF